MCDDAQVGGQLGDGAVSSSSELLLDARRCAAMRVRGSSPLVLTLVTPPAYGIATWSPPLPPVMFRRCCCCSIRTSGAEGSFGDDSAGDGTIGVPDADAVHASNGTPG